MSEVKVSIIIPAYNVEAYLRDCLKSLVMQTLEEIEVIVVNDGSTDETQQVIDEFKNKYPNIIKSLFQENSGPSAARNLALSVAKGRYIGFVDSDDTVRMDMFEKMYTIAESNQAELVLCGRAYVNEEGKVDSTWMPREIKGYSSIFEIPALLSDTSSFLWDKLFRADVIRKHNMSFNEDIHYAEDAIFVYCYMYYVNRISSIKEPLYYYTVKRDGSITKSMDNRILHEILACKQITSFYKSEGFFKVFEQSLLWICIGFFMRKFSSFAEYSSDFSLKYRFVCEFQDFLEEHYSGWKKAIRQYKTKGSNTKYKINYYRTSKRLCGLYLRLPYEFILFTRNARKLLEKAKKLFRIKETLKKIKKRFLWKPYYNTYIEALEDNVINNRILYIPNSGDNLVGNVYYLMRDAYRRGKYEIIVACKNIKKEKKILDRSGITIKLVEMHSVEFQKVLATAKYLVSNYRLPTYYCKKENQVLLNTWHGTPLKCLGRHMQNGLIDIGNVQSQFLASDYLAYPNEYTKNKMVDAFLLDKLSKSKLLVCGYPRNDAFYDKEGAARLREELGLNNEKVFIYMPTWRGKSVTSRSSEYSGDVNKILRELDSMLDSDTIIYVKLHNLAMKQMKKSIYRHIRHFPENVEVYELCNMADGMITDYSSIFFDFANTRKNILLFTYDEEEYTKERGMYMRLDDLPFPRFKTVFDLAEYLNHWEGFIPSSEYEQFCEEFCSHDSNSVSEKINNIFLTESTYRMDNTEYSLVFAPDISSPKLLYKCLALANNSDDTLFVFSAQSINASMNSLLKMELLQKIQYVIVQNEYILTKKERKEINKSRKTGNWSEVACGAVRREKERMLPYITARNVINLSTDQMFSDISYLIQRGKIE